MYIGEDPRLTERARRFLARHSHRVPHLAEREIRAAVADRLEPAAVEAMVRFQERYGGLSYRVLGGNAMEYGLDGPPVVQPTPFGPGFQGVLDGDWTWGLDVLLDGRTAMGPGQWPYRVIDRSVDQRIERHALQVEVGGWFHRTLECRTPSQVPPVTDDAALPPVVPEAGGPAEYWWKGPDVAVQAKLSGWPADGDRWTVRYYSTSPQQAAEAERILYPSTAGYETVPATWCTVCSCPVVPGTACPRRPAG